MDTKLKALQQIRFRGDITVPVKPLLKVPNEQPLSHRVTRTKLLSNTKLLKCQVTRYLLKILSHNVLNSRKKILKILLEFKAKLFGDV